MQRLLQTGEEFTSTVLPSTSTFEISRNMVSSLIHGSVSREHVVILMHQHDFVYIIFSSVQPMGHRSGYSFLLPINRPCEVNMFTRYSSVVRLRCRIHLVVVVEGKVGWNLIESIRWSLNPKCLLGFWNILTTSSSKYKWIMADLSGWNILPSRSSPTPLLSTSKLERFILYSSS